uniref:Uncharacterized protein n=1 Tax=viral metagenome TaxID=1070528 RepID=A0A2V0RM21_9ZZZZ
MACHFPSVIEIDGVYKEGLIHTLFMTNFPLNRKYSLREGLYVDENLKDIGRPIGSVLRRCGVTHLSLRRVVSVEGRSWEMACARRALGHNGVYSGVVFSASDDRVDYGPVPGILIKKRLYDKLLYSDKIKFDLLSR